MDIGCRIGGLRLRVKGLWVYVVKGLRLEA